MDEGLNSESSPSTFATAGGAAGQPQGKALSVEASDGGVHISVDERSSFFLSVRSGFRFIATIYKSLPLIRDEKEFNLFVEPGCFARGGGGGGGAGSRAVISGSKQGDIYAVQLRKYFRPARGARAGDGTPWRVLGLDPNAATGNSLEGFVPTRNGEIKRFYSPLFADSAINLLSFLKESS